MFGSGVLDVAIGMVFLYLLSSLICSAANELISGMFSWRAKTLESGLRNLLDGSTSISKDPKDSKAPASWATKLLSHPLVDAMGADANPPSYLSAGTFSSAMMALIMDFSGEGATVDLNLLKGPQVFDMLRAKAKALNNPSLAKAVPALIEAARVQWAGNGSALGTEVGTVKSQLEGWFNNSMDRVSGWYKRRTQLSILIISLIGVTVLNIDSISVAQRLGSDSTFRAAVSAEAQVYVKSNAPPTSAASQVDAGKQLATLDQYQYPIGWKSDDLAGNNASADGWFQFLLKKLLGLLISAAAISLGAPFWFDVLSRFISIRSTGKVADTGAGTSQ